jgi:hypothetical protein
MPEQHGEQRQAVSRRSQGLKPGNQTGTAIGYGTMLTIGLVTGYLPLLLAVSMTTGLVIGLGAIYLLPRFQR